MAAASPVLHQSAAAWQGRSTQITSLHRLHVTSAPCSSAHRGHAHQGWPKCLLCFWRLGTLTLAAKTALASTLHQHCFNCERGACHPLTYLPPQLLYESPSLWHPVTPFSQAPHALPEFISNRQGQNYQRQGGVWTGRREGSATDLAQFVAGEQLL